MNQIPDQGRHWQLTILQRGDLSRECYRQRVSDHHAGLG